MGHAHHQTGFDSHAGVASLELEGEVLSRFAVTAADILRPLLAEAGTELTRVVDLGCGPGIAACDLAKVLAPASVVAVDSSVPMLERASERATRLGLSARVEVRQIDLDGDLSSLGGCDVVYTSMALHHVRDEVATLRQIRRLVEPDGLLCVLERADPVVVRLTDERARPGVWDRLESAGHRLFEDRRSHLPGATRAEMYPSMLAAAGFDVRVDETLDVGVDLDGHDAARQFAAQHLERAHEDLVGYADPSDLDVLPGLAGTLSKSAEGSSGAIHATRKLFVAAPCHGKAPPT